MANMTDRTRADSIANWIHNSGALPAQPTGHKLRLMTAQGSNTANGTEATTGNCPGYTAGGSAITYANASAGINASSAAVSWTATGAWVAIVAIEDWDIAGTPLRWDQGSITSITLGNGNTLQFASGSVTADHTQW